MPKKVGKAVAAWSKKTLIVPPGHPDEGKPLILPSYFVRFFDEVYEDGVIEGGVAISRKNAKTSCCAALILYYLCGPGYREGFRGAVLSTNAETAGVMLEIIKELVKSSGLPVESRSQPLPGWLFASDGDATVKFMNSSRSSSLGANLDLAICDEYGEFTENSRKNIEMLLSSMPLKPHARLIGIGVQAHSHLFQEMKSRADRPTTVWHEYVGFVSAPVTDIASIKAANPGILAGIVPLSGILKSAQRAENIPATEYEFRKYHLNLPSQESKNLLIKLPDYEKHVIVKDLPPRAGKCSLGVDIGYSESATGACAFWSESGRLETFAAMPSIPDPHSRGLKDGVGSVYLDANRRGELELHEGRITDVNVLMTMLARELVGEDVEMCADGFRVPEVVTAMERFNIRWPVDYRRQGGGRDNWRDILDAQKLMLSGKVSASENLMMYTAIRHATLKFQESNNFCSLRRYKSNSRIDVASALVLALGHGARQLDLPKPRKRAFAVR